MHHETLTHPHSPLHNELRALSQENHSPSSAAIHAAVLISTRIEVGYGEIYTIIPHAESAHFAALAAQEMEARCPFLLAVIRSAITANKNRVVVEVLSAPKAPKTPDNTLSAHAKIHTIPRLITWLLGQPKPASLLQDPP